MSISEGPTLLNGNKRGYKGVGSRNKFLVELQRIGEENCRTLYDMQLQAAFKGDLEAGQFLLNKILPNIKPGRIITIDLPEMDSIENVVKAESVIFKNVSTGDITVEEGEKLFNMAEHTRKSIETKEIIEKINAVESRMKEAGI